MDVGLVAQGETQKEFIWSLVRRFNVDIFQLDNTIGFVDVVVTVKLLPSLRLREVTKVKQILQ